MKFFTPAWHGGEMPDEAAERVPAAYEAHLTALGPTLPNEARRLWTEVNLHDALVLGVARESTRLVLLLRAGDQKSGYVDARLSYDGVEVTPDEEQFLNGAMGRRDIEVLHDEFDASGNRWVHSFLFWPYREVSVHFSTLKLDVTAVSGRVDGGS